MPKQWSHKYVINYSEKSLFYTIIPFQTVTQFTWKLIIKPYEHNKLLQSFFSISSYSPKN